VRQHRRRLGPRGGAHRDPAAGRGRDQLRHAGIRDDLAAADHHQVVRGVLQLAHQMAGYQHGPALGGQRPQEPAYPHDALGIHAVERLVHHQHRRITEERGGDPQPLPHAKGEPAGLAPDRGAQPGLLHDLVDPFGVQALGVGQPQQVVAGAPARLQRGGVQQRPDMAQRVPQAGVGLPADQRGALIRGIEAEDHPHRGGFPGAVRADKAGHLARGDRERHPVQGQHRPEALTQAVDFNGCLHALTVWGTEVVMVVTPGSGLRLPPRRDGGIPGRGDATPRPGGDNDLHGRSR